MPLGSLVLERNAALQQAHRGDAAQDPGQLGDLGHIRLAPEGGLLRIEPAGEEVDRQIPHMTAQGGGIVDRGERVVVGDEIKGLALLLQPDGRLHHAEVIANVETAAGLDAGENAHGKGDEFRSNRVGAPIKEGLIGESTGYDRARPGECEPEAVGGPCARVPLQGPGAGTNPSLPDNKFSWQWRTSQQLTRFTPFSRGSTTNLTGRNRSIRAMLVSV
jgi:hypothetical protein